MNLIKCKEQHCLITTKVYDWIYKLESFSCDPLKVNLPCYSEPKRCIEGDLFNEQMLLWRKGAPSMTAFGTISISVNQQSSPLEIHINGELVHTLDAGDCHSFTYDQINDIIVKTSGISSFQATLQVHYQHKLSEDDNLKLTCELFHLECTEVTKSNLRKDVVIYKEGKPITLQKVILQKSGCFSLCLYKHKQLIWKTVVPFCFLETVYLCAPPTTDVDCTIVTAECDPHIVFVNGKPCIQVQLTFCQNILVTGEIVVSTKGTPCEPRKHITLDKAPCPVYQLF
ncbi:S-Ena type endospore appendage [Alteribacter aurantiacus]|uniref:S-Ena type endospore appendage n=1 Tax=Alteribacter aurantiacus TaxID=254410 RepID=UPI0004093EE4|nr:S-Ena type endospore appendage [Alteribacter aurantiacus]